MNCVAIGDEVVGNAPMSGSEEMMTFNSTTEDYEFVQQVVEENEENSMQNSSASMESLSSPNAENNISIQRCVYLLQAPSLFHQFPVVKPLFEKLSLRDLLSSAQVCKLWAEVACVVRKQRRNKPFIFLYHPYLPHTKEVVDYYNGLLGHQVSEESICFVERELLAPISDSMDSRFTVYPTVSEEIRPSILDCFNNCYHEPQMVVYFGTSAVSSCLSKRLTPKQKYTQNQHLFEGIRAIGPSVAVFGTGVVLSDPSNNYFFEMEYNAYPMLTALAIPKIPGFSVKLFNVDENVTSRFKGKVDAQTCTEILCIEPEDRVKGIILFQSDRKRSAVLSEAVFNYLNSNPNVAVGGGAMPEIITSLSEGKSSRGCGLLLCGESVNVYTVGLFDIGMTDRNEAELVKVKNSNFQSDCSFAFMFACNGRGAHMHKGICHVESALFKKHFPDTPLIGGFTCGEYIHPYIPGQAASAPRSRKSLEYGFTTVFVIVSVVTALPNVKAK